MTLRWKDWVFSLSDDGEITVSPTLTGEELDSLELTIKRWEFVVQCLELGCEVTSAGEGYTCGLCARYRFPPPPIPNSAPSLSPFHSRRQAFCAGCPVRNFTGKQFCSGTPLTFVDPYDTATTLTLAVAKAIYYSLKALQEYLNRKKGE